jgi:hypothetical protein
VTTLLFCAQSRMNPSFPAGQPVRRLRWDIFTVTFGTKSLSSTLTELVLEIKLY